MRGSGRAWSPFTRPCLAGNFCLTECGLYLPGVHRPPAPCPPATAKETPLGSSWAPPSSGCVGSGWEAGVAVEVLHSFIYSCGLEQTPASSLVSCKPAQGLAAVGLRLPQLLFSSLPAGLGREIPTGRAWVRLEPV